MDEDLMTVAFERSPMCEKCGACEMANEQMRMQLKRAKGAEVGDEVQINLKSGTVLKAAFITYGIPLIMMILGLVIGNSLPLPGNKDVYAIACGVLLAGLAFLVIRLTEPRRRREGTYTPEVVHIEKLCRTGGIKDGK